MEMIKIHTDNLNDVCPLYRKYPRQFKPQPAYIELDCRDEGELSADWNGEIGNGVKPYIWYNLAVQWAVPSKATGDSLRSLFENDEFLGCCQRILNGFDEIWDGSNRLGQYTAEAQKAIQEVEDLVSRFIEECEVWDAEDWIFGDTTLGAVWPDQPLDEVVARLEMDVENYGVYLDGDIEDALITKAKVSMNSDSDRVERHHVKILWARGEITLKQVREWLRETM